MLTFTDDDVKAQIAGDTGGDTGIRQPFALEAFSDDDVRESTARIKASPFVPKKRLDPRVRVRRRHRQAAGGRVRLNEA